MRHLKCSIKVCNILLLVSVIFNMALLIIVYIEESRGLVFSAALERRDKIEYCTREINVPIIMQEVPGKIQSKKCILSLM